MPLSIQARSTRTIILHFCDILSWAPVPGNKSFLFTLLTKQADILFAEEAVRLSVEKVLTFFSNDSPRDDLWVRMTLLLERSQSHGPRTMHVG